MKHDHKHNHCQHENLKFCVTCDKPHCLDCGQEWNLTQYVIRYEQPIFPFIDRSPTWTVPYTPEPYCGDMITGTTTGGTTLAPLSQTVGQSEPAYTLTTSPECSHGRTN